MTQNSYDRIKFLNDIWNASGTNISSEQELAHQLSLALFLGSLRQNYSSYNSLDLRTAICLGTAVVAVENFTTLEHPSSKK